MTADHLSRPKLLPFCACGLVAGAYAFLLLALAVQAEQALDDHSDDTKSDEVDALLTNVEVILAGLDAYGVMWAGVEAMASEWSFRASRQIQILIALSRGTRRARGGDDVIRGVRYASCVVASAWASLPARSLRPRYTSTSMHRVAVSSQHLYGVASHHTLWKTVPSGYCSSGFSILRNVAWECELTKSE